MVGFSGVVCCLLFVKSKLVDFTICGKPMRSSSISKPRAIIANAPAVATGMPNNPSMPTMPISCTPIPAGVIGTNARAVTRGCIRKNAIQGTLMPKAIPRNHHSNPFRSQHIRVIAIISGMAFCVLCALSLNSSSLLIMPPVERFKNCILMILGKIKYTIREAIIDTNVVK